jgi:tRNA1Val (adenine37-N6)-methyltransferase
LIEPRQMDLPPEEEISADRIAGDWQIFQLKRGHRFSADDLLTAWLACELAPGGGPQLDLGAGVGSVGLMCLWRRGPEARLVMVEAQEVSHRLALRSIAANGLDDRVEARLGDLRAPASIPEARAFPLVTGSPPYIPVGRGVISPHPQRAACRMELRGDIADYAAAAARALADGGVFVFCHAANDPRPEPAVAAAGLHLRLRQDVCFRQGRPPTISLFAARREPGPLDHRPPLVLRDAGGACTPAYLELRQRMGTEDPGS